MAPKDPPPLVDPRGAAPGLSEAHSCAQGEPLCQGGALHHAPDGCEYFSVNTVQGFSLSISSIFPPRKFPFHGQKFKFTNVNLGTET